MLKRIAFILLLILLGVLLYLNPNFETIAAGIAILLFGMVLLESGFKTFTKGPLQGVLKRATNKLYKSISVGALVTTLIQSSSLVSVITISFISAGLITLAGGIGLVFGANIGSTTTAWLVAGFGLKIKISALAMPMIIFGLIFTLQKSSTLKGIGNVLAGLGFFFLGIYFMKEGFDVFSTNIDLTQYAVSGFKGVLLYTLIGIIITVLLQSSAASLVLVLTALAAGQVVYENALALAIGANIGTTITAVLGSLSSNISGKRLAGAHLIFNIITGIVALALIYPLAQLVNKIAEIVHIDATDYTLKLALFHTIFNVLGVIIMIPFIKKLERLLIKFLKEPKESGIDVPMYLNKSVLAFPTAVTTALINESKHLYKNTVFEIVSHAINIHREDILSDTKLKHIIRSSHEDFETNVDQLYRTKVKSIYGEIIKYASTAQSTLLLNGNQNKILTEIKVANRKMVEIVKDSSELNRNINLVMQMDNPHLTNIYDGYRKKIMKVLRIIYMFRTENEEDNSKDIKKLMKLKKEASANRRLSNKAIDELIRKNLISAEMASSLFNDYTNMNDIIKKMIEVAELLYDNKDTLFENSAV